MKKFAMLLLSAIIAVSCAGCAGTVAPSFFMPDSWTKTPSSVYEHAVYKINRYTVTSAEDKLNPQGESVANGEQTVTIQYCKGEDYPNCLELLNKTELIYTKDSYAPNGLPAKIGDRFASESRVVFSVSTSSVMTTKYAEKKIFSSADPSVNLDYTANYVGGLKVTNYLVNEKGERLKNADGSEKKETYSFKAKKVASMFDNEQWMLINRFASNFKAEWSGSYSLVSVPEIIYNDGKLATFSLSAKASAQVTRNLSAMESNIVLSPTDSFATTDKDGNFQADCADVSIASNGSMGVNRGPVLYASYITSRSVETLPLANLLLQYAQNEYSTSGVLLYSTVARLKTASIKPEA